MCEGYFKTILAVGETKSRAFYWPDVYVELPVIGRIYANNREPSSYQFVFFCNINYSFSKYFINQGYLFGVEPPEHKYI